MIDRSLLDDSIENAKAALEEMNLMRRDMLLHSRAVSAQRCLRIASAKMNDLEQQLAGQPKPKTGD